MGRLFLQLIVHDCDQKCLNVLCQVLIFIIAIHYSSGIRKHKHNHHCTNRNLSLQTTNGLQCIVFVLIQRFENWTIFPKLNHSVFQQFRKGERKTWSSAQSTTSILGNTFSRKEVYVPNIAIFLKKSYVTIFKEILSIYTLFS